MRSSVKRFYVEIDGGSGRAYYVEWLDAWVVVVQIPHPVERPDAEVDHDADDEDDEGDDGDDVRGGGGR
ncbi:hypothetical protein BBBOND_0304150 [Babesia bigemina]|uniref:Uncharacterized protein n=1 Tax=Babesia bigemina TaxID=5866 RepID=A0A061D722_BABBI|nr:hypothetical protein BBBOND_0304150 [Babesia bigemina]CDR96511.1 hypothetical protein BBBOND_0304150 [Babesia bigemina]|eukprot:XP_012768697.1 hypothetical protein BBBOND_0304150 [Babesia bigemina]